MTEFRTHYGLLMAMAMMFGALGVVSGAKLVYCPSQLIPQYQGRLASERCSQEAQTKKNGIKNEQGKAKNDAFTDDQEALQTKYKGFVFEVNQQDSGGGDQGSDYGTGNNNDWSQQIPQQVDGKEEAQEDQSPPEFQLPHFVREMTEEEKERLKSHHHKKEVEPLKKSHRRSLKNYRDNMVLGHSQKSQHGWWLWEKVDDLRNKLSAKEQRYWLKRLKEEPFMEVKDAFLEKHSEISRTLADAFLESLLDEGVIDDNEQTQGLDDEDKAED